MPNSSSHQNNNIVSQAVVLPTAYLNYLSRSRARINSDWARNNVTLTHELQLFPGLETGDHGQEGIEVLINKRTLPFSFQSIDKQTVILDALKVLQSISNLSADVIDPKAQKEMAQSIQNALKGCLLSENSKRFKLAFDPKVNIMAQLARIVTVSAVITAGLFLLAPLLSPILLTPIIIPPLLVAVASVILMASLTAILFVSFQQSNESILASVSAMKESKAAFDELTAVIKTAAEEIENLSPKKPEIEEPQAFPSAASAVNGSSSSKSYGASGSPTLYRQAAANNLFEQADVQQGITATTSNRPN